jgi:hypothetical protein
MFHVLLLHYILWSLRFLWCLSICITYLLKGDTKSPQFFNQFFNSMLHEKLNNWKMTGKKLCIFLFLHDLFAICEFNQCPPLGWLCTCIVLYLSKSQYCWWLGKRVLSLPSPGLEWTASADPTLPWRYKVAGSIDLPLHFIPPPHLLRKDGGHLCFARWVPNIITIWGNLKKPLGETCLEQPESQN